MPLPDRPRSPTSAPQQLLSMAISVLLLFASGCRGFVPVSSTQREAASSLCYHYAAGSGPDAAVVPDALHMALKKPHWVPHELAELAADDAGVSPEEFVRTHADVEAYTSCDDEGDDFHECDFMSQFLGPTKWLHLTKEARDEMDDAHFMVWKDVWKNPHGAVELADKVSKECLRFYKEFMLEPRPSSIKCFTDRPLVRVKVVPASFGLEGFEDAVWEATEDLLELEGGAGVQSTADATGQSSVHEACEAITFVVAAPDLFTDPILAEGGGKASPQAEFEPDRFGHFSSSLREKMVAFSESYRVPLEETIRLTPFHPLWKQGSASGSRGEGARESFPYPCVAVSTEVQALDS